MKIVISDTTEKQLFIDDGNDCFIKFFLHKGEQNKKTVFVIPGGAYGGICTRENEAIAKRFFKSGYNACYINYSVGKAVKFPKPVNECRAALNYIFSNAESLGIDKNGVFLIGFSAGAHLAGLVENLRLSSLTECLIKPKGIIYCYPVVSTKRKFIHERSFNNLLKEDFDKYLSKVSLETIITKHSAPSFIFHCIDDKEVSYKNSILLHSAYMKSHISSELHLFPKGGHGVAIPTLECFTKDELKYIDKDIVVWFDLCLRWLRRDC